MNMHYMRYSTSVKRCGIKLALVLKECCLNFAQKMRFEQFSCRLGLGTSVSIKHFFAGCEMGAIRQFYPFQNPECSALLT